MTKRRLFFFGSASAVFIICVAYLAWPTPTADQVMADFHKAEWRAEAMLMDPLILNSDLVAPVVIENVKNKGMDKRRYAIGFLGNERITDAVPVLRSIWADESEMDHFRADALSAIFQINKQEGLSLAEAHSHEDDFLGHIARGLLSGDHIPFRRTYAEALVGHKD